VGRVQLEDGSVLFTFCASVITVYVHLSREGLPLDGFIVAHSSGEHEQGASL